MWLKRADHYATVPSAFWKKKLFVPFVLLTKEGKKYRRKKKPSKTNLFIVTISSPMSKNYMGWS